MKKETSFHLVSRSGADQGCIGNWVTVNHAAMSLSLGRPVAFGGGCFVG